GITRVYHAQDQRTAEVKKRDRGISGRPPTLEELFFNINYYLCKQYPAFTPFEVDACAAEDVLNLYGDTKRLDDEINMSLDEPQI
ncbi:hypothetical protein, partial [Pseudomonas aeruginosa]|uniref:hypothetical protein n=1 Tax=Pseudomonas aeruginosa TaxID=287 RepID=UPI001E46C0BF